MSVERLKALAQSDPEEFRKLMVALRKKTVIPHEAQRPVVESKARFKVMNCGRRFGKTVIAAKIIVAKTRKDDQMLWWVAPTYRIVKRGYAEVLKQLPDGVLTHEPPPESNFDAGRSVILRFKNGTKMEFYSAERPEGMLGAGVDYVVLDEAATMPARVWNQIISPTLMDREGGALMISTPRGQNWFYQCWLRGQDPEQKEWESWTFTTQDNPTLPPGEADRMAADMPRMEADQEIYAKWLAAGSSVFYIPEEAIQKLPDGSDPLIYENGLIEGFPPKGYVVLGVDLARTNDYTVFYGCRMRDRRNCYYERMQDVTWPEQKRRLRRAVRRLLQNGAESVMLLMDSTGVGDPVYEDMEAEGYDAVPINFTTHKANMVRLLSKDLEEAQAFVLRDAQLEEFRSYMMNVSPAGRYTYSAPEGQNDDVVSAKMLAHWGVINEGFGDITIISAAPATTAPEDEDEAGDVDDFSDLIDLDEGEALEEIGLANPYKRPSPAEVMANPHAWGF